MQDPRQHLAWLPCPTRHTCCACAPATGPSPQAAQPTVTIQLPDFASLEVLPECPGDLELLAQGPGAEDADADAGPRPAVLGRLLGEGARSARRAKPGLLSRLEPADARCLGSWRSSPAVCGRSGPATLRRGAVTTARYAAAGLEAASSSGRRGPGGEACLPSHAGLLRQSGGAAGPAGLASTAHHDAALGDLAAPGPASKGWGDRQRLPVSARLGLGCSRERGGGEAHPQRSGAGPWLRLRALHASRPPQSCPLAHPKQRGPALWPLLAA